MKNCPNCNGQISDTAKFCKHCGNKIEQKPQFVFCEECGAKIDANAPFCEECGAKTGEAQADDPWSEFDKPKNDDPWASFADYKEPETIVIEKIVEKPVEIVKEKVVQVEKPVAVSKPATVSASVESDYQAGMKILKRCTAEKKVLPAIDLIMPKANMGDKQAMLAVARAYRTIFKYDKALEWYKKTDDSSLSNEIDTCIYAKALQMIRNGDGAENKDLLKEGIELLEQFANRGNLAAQHMLAYGYNKFGDNASAYKWYKCSADAGYHDSQYSLGQGYQHGWYGLPVDKNKAYQWFKTAADNGNSYAKIELDYWDR